MAYLPFKSGRQPNIERLRFKQTFYRIIAFCYNKLYVHANKEYGLSN